MTKVDKAIDEILHDTFVGLYGKQPSSNGMAFEFIRMEDNYDVLKNSLKDDIQSLLDQEKQALIKEILEEAKTYSNVTYDFGTAMVVNEVKAVPVATIKKIGKS